MPTDWAVSIYSGVVNIKIGGEVLYENKLTGSCREQYSTATRFSFTGDPAVFSFVPEEMEVGEKVTSAGCPGTGG